MKLEAFAHDVNQRDISNSTREKRRFAGGGSLIERFEEVDFQKGGANAHEVDICDIERAGMLLSFRCI